MPYPSPIFAVLVLLCFSRALLPGAEEKTAAELAAAADTFAKSYEKNWLSDYTKRVTGFAEEIAELYSLDEVAKKTLIEAASPLGRAITEHWMKLYRGYYAPHLKLWGEDTYWDDYLPLCLSPEAIAGQRELFAQWESMLKAQLKPQHYALWQAEMKTRREWRVRARDAAVKIQLDNIAKSVRQDFDKQLAELASLLQFKSERIAVLKPAVDAAVQAHVASRRPAAEQMAKWCDEEFFRYATKSLTAWEKEGKMGSIMNQPAADKAASLVFDAALKKLLTPAEAAQMHELVTAKKQRINKAAKSLAESLLDGMPSRGGWRVAADTDILAAELGLDSARQAKITAHFKEADKAIIATWLKATESYLIQRINERMARSGNSDDLLKQIEAGRYGFGTSTDDDEVAVKAKDEAWATALKTTLTTDEILRWETLQKEQAEANSQLLAHIAVAELDRKLLLLTEQRDKLEVLAIAAAKTLAPDTASLQEFLRNYGASYSAALIHGMDAKAVDAILDKEQSKSLIEIKARYDGYWSSMQRLKGKKR